MRQTYRLADGQIERQTDRQTERQTERPTDVANVAAKTARFSNGDKRR